MIFFIDFHILNEYFLIYNIANTYRNQSTAMMSVMSSVGRPTDVSTITMVTSPAWGIPAAPILAAVAVMLMGKSAKKKADGEEFELSKNHLLQWNCDRHVPVLNSPSFLSNSIEEGCLNLFPWLKYYPPSVLSWIPRLVVRKSLKL